MNRRIVIVDDVSQNPLNYYGTGLGSEIYSVDSLLKLEEPILQEKLKLGPGDGAMLIGPRAFELPRKFYHYGIRGEDYWDCSQLRRL